jgi:hypothetical protein
MPGAIAAGFHEGSRSEILADYLFSAWGGVTPVRRADDYGVDLYCALTERIEQLARVREYFGVQVKSTNDPWTLTGAEVKWLVECPTPLFLCVVNKKKWLVRVYHLLPRFQAWALGQLPDVLELIPGEGTDGDFLGWTEGSSFSLSAPIIEAGLDDLNEPGRMDELKKVFACWVEMDRDNCDLVRQGLLRFRRPQKYRVNEKPSVDTELGFTRPDPDLLNRGLLRLVQAVECIGGQLAHGGDLDAGLKAALFIDRIQTNYPEAFHDNRWWQHRVPGSLMQMVVFPLNRALGHTEYVYSGLDAANDALIKDPIVQGYLHQVSEQLPT